MKIKDKNRIEETGEARKKKSLLKRIWDPIYQIGLWVKGDRVAAFAAQASYYLLLSAVPFTIMVLTFMQFLPFEQTEFLAVIRGFLPDDVETWFMKLVFEMIDSTNAAVMSISMIFAVWAASRGIYSITYGLNSVFRTQESRSFIVLRVIATGQTFLMAIAMVALMVVFVFGNAINAIIVNHFYFIAKMERLAAFIISVRFSVGLVLLFFLFLFLYQKLPNHKISWKQAVPGALFSALMWIFVSILFSTYYTRFSKYSTVYGSLTGVAVAMLWFYALMLVLLIGGEINMYFILYHTDFTYFIRDLFRRKNSDEDKRKHIENEKKV